MFERTIHLNWKKKTFWSNPRRHDAQSPPAQITLSSVSPLFEVRMSSCEQFSALQQTGYIRIAFWYARRSEWSQPFTALRPAVLGRALLTALKDLCGATVVRGSNCVLRVSATLCGLSKQRHGVMRAPYALYRSFLTFACMLQHHILNTYGKVE